MPTSRKASTVHHRDELDAVQRELREITGPHGSDLRSDLRRGETPPPQARPVSRSAEACLHQRCSSAKAAAIVRQTPTAFRCSRSKPNSAASGRSISRTATRTFPASRAFARASSRCMAAPLQDGPKLRGRFGQLFADLPLPARRRTERALSASSSPASAAPASSPSARSWAWRRISKATAAPFSTSPGLRKRTAR